jgi:hypothetical protein
MVQLLFKMSKLLLDISNYPADQENSTGEWLQAGFGNCSLHIRGPSPLKRSIPIASQMERFFLWLSHRFQSPDHKSPSVSDLSQRGCLLKAFRIPGRSLGARVMKRDRVECCGAAWASKKDSEIFDSNVAIVQSKVNEITAGASNLRGKPPKSETTERN